MRESTERPETVKIGANHIAGTKKETILQIFNMVVGSLTKSKKWKNPYGDGKTSKRIIDTCIYGKPENQFAEF